MAQVLSEAEKNQLNLLNKTFAEDSSAVSLNYSWLLYRSGGEGSKVKADYVLNSVIALQDHNPESFMYGQWGWREDEAGRRSGDQNNALFQAHIMFCGLWNEQDKMSPETRENFLLSCRHMTEAVVRRWDYEVFDIYRDFTAYSNAFVMYVQTFILAGERFDNERLRKQARAQWTRWYNHISFFGIDEFASPGYNRVIFNALDDIRNFSPDERIRNEAKEVMDHIYLLQSAITHPLLKLPLSGISRDYRNFIAQGDMRSEIFINPLPASYDPPHEAIEINRDRKYPFEVTGKASAMPFIFRSYQMENAAMGSMTGGAVFQQQIHCIAAVGKNENERAVAFLQGSFTPVNGYTDQIGTSTLCIYNRLPAYWHLTQKHGVLDMDIYKETFGEFGLGITPGWKEKLKAPDHIVLEAYGYDLHIFPFRITEDKIVPCDLELKHRTTTSPVYHPRPRVFDEYVFPEEPEWFGAYLVLAETGEKVKKPVLGYRNVQGIRTFSTNVGHTIRLFVAEKGDTRQLYNVDPALIPLLKISR
ncbi:MAG: hypothetical protein MUE74_00100 [Bacteroidales bacterium]|nr:hypothetical protein [Bacteroidales bacterium]